MTHLDRMSISGVRSFDPNDQQEIKFFPLTMILGPNGAGKTTIIESLKYATTGDLPPNCNKGQCFVHDAQFANEPRIRGQVRLRFVDYHKKLTTITRGMETNVKGGGKGKPTVTFKQINSVIKREDKSIDQKCADLNSEMLDLIRVSKAVLNNVTFCHQEDTNWPLSGGKELKEKFDDIFGSIGYVKMLDKIKKTRDEEMKKLKLLDKDVTIYTNLKREVDGKRRQLRNEQNKLDSENVKLDELNVKKDQAAKKLEDLIAKEAKAEDLMNEISQIEGSIDEKKKLANEIKSTCSAEMHSKTKEQVEEELNNFDDNSSELIAKKKELEATSQKIESSYFELLSNKQKISNDLAKITGCKNQIQKDTTERNTLIGKLDSKSVELKRILKKIDFNEDLTNRDCELVIQLYRNQMDEIQNSSNEKKSTIKRRQSDLKQSLDSLKSQRSNAFHEKDIWQNQYSKIEMEIAELSQTEYKSEVFSAQLQTLAERITHYQNLISQFDNVDDDEQKENIANFERKKDELKGQIERLQHEIAIANSNNEEMIKFDILKKQKEKEEAKMREIKAKHSEVFWKVNADDGSFYSKLNEYINKLTKQFDESSSNAASIEKDYFVKKNKLDLQQELIAKKTKELANLKSKFEDLCNLDEFETFVESKERELNDLRTEKSNLSNITPIIECQITMITKQEMCPVCENDLSINWVSKKSGKNLNRQNLIDNLEKTKVDNPTELNQINIKIREGEKFYNQLLLLKSDFESVKIITDEIPLLKNHLIELKEETEELRKLVEKEKTNLSFMKAKIDKRREGLQDANDFDNSFRELKLIKQNLEQIDNSKWTDGVDIDCLSGKLKEKQLELQSTDNKLSELQNERLRASEEKMKLQNQLQAAERNKAEYEKRERQKIANLNKQKELAVQRDELKRKVSALETKTHELAPEINAFEAELQSIENDLRQIEKESQQRIYQCEDSIKKLKTLFDEIKTYSQQLKEAESKTSQEYIQQLESGIKKLESEKKAISKQINNISQDIANFEVKKRELKDYQKYLNLIEGITEQRGKLRERRSKFGSVDLTSLKRARISAEKEVTETETKLNGGHERASEIEERITALETELKEEQYSTAMKKFKQSNVKKTISEMTCEDLDKYYKALDFSISSFHKHKMTEINKLLKKFWEIAYQGRDIDYIKIVSDEEERSASDKRRTFNYRVVMVRNGREMDMKGRCSAGQKVLASLIIRLSLALIFCHDFAVLTLDEPTTNLDKANIRAFARAVSALIKSYKNFQIIIITHDDEFLGCLDPNITEYYYKVAKNEAGYSTIVQKSLNDDTQVFATSKSPEREKEEEEGDDEEVKKLQSAPKRAKLSQK